MNDRSAEPDTQWPGGLFYGSMVMIVLGALTFVGIGLLYIVYPTKMNAGGDLIYLSGTAENEVRAIYGGLELGLGLFWVWSLFDRERYKSALILLALTVGLAGSARFIGMFANSTWESSMLIFALSEVGGGAIAALIAIGIHVQVEGE